MDKQRFAEEVKAMERSLYRVARSYLRHDADAADAVQDALLRAWDKRNSLRDEVLFHTWVTRILINVCKDQLKHSHDAQPLAEIPEDHVQLPSREREIRAALDALDVKLAVPLTLFYLDGYSLREIGQMLRLPQGTVKNRLFRGRQKLKEMLNEEVLNDEA